MSDLLVTCTLNSGTGLASDKFVNNWAVRDFAGDLELLGDTFAGFYTTLFGSLGALVPMSEFLSGIVNNTAGQGLTVRAFDIDGHLDGSPHGSAIHEETFTVPSPAGSWADMPSEVACCITLEGFGRSTALVEVPDGPDAGAEIDRPKQRHTGRVYFGPVNSNAVEMVSGIVRVSNAFRDTARIAVDGLARNIQGLDAAADLSVWSRKDATLRRVANVSVDNAVDIIRSRGEKASLRETSPVNAP